MTDLRRAALMALEALELPVHSQARANASAALRDALAHPLTDEQISVLWHQSGEQPFKFARMLLK